MAKKITEEQNNPAGEATVNPTDRAILPENENTGSTEIEKADSGTRIQEETLPEAKAPSVRHTQPVTENYPPFVEAMLKAFTGYESLYVDSHGGTYSPDTSQQVRGNAVLYKNPYHKS